MRISVFVAAVALLLPGCGAAASSNLIASLEQLAKAGNAEAIYHLGMAYQTGSGVAEDHVKALAAFRRAATLGEPLGAYKLGCYYAGQGGDLLAPDPKEALRYKLIAAEAGYALAQQDVGVMYATAGDIETGMKWIGKSAAQGWSGGLMTLASAYKGASGVPADPAKTAAYFRLFMDRTEPTETQLAWLRDYESKLTPAERSRAEAIVRDYEPHPTSLTLKALAGQRSAEVLVARVQPK